MKKRLLSLLLCLCMVLTLLPVTVWALEDPVATLSWIEEGQSKTEDLGASDLPGCCEPLWSWDSVPAAARTDAATLTLLEDVTLEYTLPLEYAGVTLDGGGHTLTKDFNGGRYGDPMVRSDAGRVGDFAVPLHHTLENVTLDGTYCGQEEATDPPSAVDVEADSTLTMKNADIVNGGQPPAAWSNFDRVPTTAGGVKVKEDAILKLENGSSITGSRGMVAGGVYAQLGSRVELSGQVEITGNTKDGQPSNLVLMTTPGKQEGSSTAGFVPAQITAPVAGSSIGVSRLAYENYNYVTAPGVVAVGEGYTLTQDDLAAFFSDDPLYAPSLDVVNNAIVLGDLPPHTHAMSVGCETTSGDQLTYKPLTVNGEGKLCVDGAALTPDRYGDYTLGGGNYYLPGDIALDDSLIYIKDANSAPTNLCLNGHTLDLGEGGIEVKKSSPQGGVLNLCDCGRDGKVTSAYEYAKQTATIESGYKFFLYGGRVENTAGSQAVTAFGGTASLYGGEAVSTQGYAVMVDYNSGSALSLSGAPKLQSGAGKADINLYNEDKDTPIVLDGPLTAAQPYTVTGNRAQPVVTATWREHMAGKNFADYFQSAAQGLFVEENDSGELVLTDCAITQQPTAANGYTVATNGAPASVPTYQWYSATASKKTVATENSDTCVMAEPYEFMQVKRQPGDTIDIATYANGTWTPAQDYDRGGYFTIALEKGDVLTLAMATAAVPPAGQIGLYGGYDHETGTYAALFYYLDGSQPPDRGVSITTQGDNTLLAYTIPADRRYELVIGSLDYYDENDPEDSYKNYTAPALSATVTRPKLGAALAGQDTPTLTAAQAGDYLCQVTWPNGTKQNSDIVTYTPPHIHAMSVDCETTGEDLVTFDKAITVNDQGELCVDGAALTPGSSAYILSTGHYYLAGDVTLPDSSYYLYIGEGANVDLCLNGYTLNLGIVVNGQLRLCDCSADKTGAIVNGDCQDLIQVTGDFALYGGTVKHTGENEYATAITTSFWGTATLYGGQVIAEHGDALWYDYTANALTLYDGVTLQGGADSAEVYLGDMVGFVGTDGYDTSVITIAEPLTAPETPWRVSSFQTQVFTDGWARHMADKDFNDYFICIDQGRFIEKTGSGELALADYAITAQPSAANGYTVTANGAPSGYQWYKATVTTAEITDQNATPYEFITGSIAPASYENGKWTAAQSVESPEAAYFTVTLQKGDKVTLTLDQLPTQGQLGLYGKEQLWCYFGGSREPDKGVSINGSVITYVIPADGDYKLVLDGLGDGQTAPVLSVQLTRVTAGQAVSGQTAKTLTTDTAGTYLCQVSWADGTALNSDVVVYTPAPKPTPTPTAKPSPSAAPSVTPSAAPSVTPSAAPSVTPSAAPSVTPSAAPSVPPSAAPSVTPSAAPSVTPSVAPSVTPSAAPTPDQGETKGQVEVKSDTPAVRVDEEVLKDLAGEVQQGQSVTVKLTVEKQEAPADKVELESVIQGKRDDVLYLDLSLFRQVNDAQPQAITDTGDRVLEIAVPYDFTGKTDVTVYRKHGDSAAQTLTKLAARPAKDLADGTFFADAENGVVYIYASKFSTYAIGYTAKTASLLRPGRAPNLPKQEEETTAWPFTDVKVGDDCYESVKVVYEKGWMLGTSGTTFEPKGTLSRAMLATILYRAAGSPRVESAPAFDDTLANAWYSDAVAWASQTQVLRGYGNGKFGPQDPVSKEMMNLVTARQAGEDPAWVGDPALAVPATRAEAAQAVMEWDRKTR